MEKRQRSEFERSRKAPKPQSRIAEYIKGKLSLDQIVPKDRIIKPEERHNKRAFLPHINDQVKIVPRKIRDAKTIEVKIDTRRPVQRSKTKIQEYDPVTEKYRTPEQKEKKKQVFSFDFDDCYVVINKGAKSINAIEYRQDGDYSTPSESQAPTPSTQSSCNDIVPVISNVNNTAPDTTYYEETLATKNDEISMLKEKIRNLQKNIVAKNAVDTDDENVLEKILQSLDHFSNAVKILKNTDDQAQIVHYVAQIEQEKDKWYSYAATISDGMKTLKHLNTTLKAENNDKAGRLEEKQRENKKLQNKLLELKQEAVALKKEKLDYNDMLDSTRHTLKLAEKDNHNLRQQLQHHKRLAEKATEELNMLNEAYEKVKIEIEDKERAAIEVSESLNKQIAELEVANSQLLSEYTKACDEVANIDQKYQRDVAAAEQKYKEEVETFKAAKQVYSDTLQKEADKLKMEIEALEENVAEMTRKNEQYYSRIVQLTSENQTLKEDSKYMSCEKKQLDDAVNEWCKSEAVQDSVNLIAMIDNLKMRMVIAETNYSNRLMENLEQTVKFTHLLNDQSDQ